jgi:3-oxoacyl-[acyl-carrier-protein] synthase-3
VGAVIAGTGVGLPDRVVSNESLEARLGIPAGGILRRTGIRTRRWVEGHQAASDLAAIASRAALAAAGREAADLDLILVSTTSPDMGFASTACQVQRELKAPKCAALDLAASCTGFLYGLAIAQAFLRTGQARTVLLAAGEVKSRFIDQDDPSSAILFGDGAGAVVLTDGPPDRGVVDVSVHADGTRWPLIHLPAGGSREPMTAETVAARRHTMRLNGPAIFRAAVRTLEGTVRERVAAHGLRLDQIDHFFFHQANARILEQVRRRLGIAPERTPLTLTRYGNTSSSTLPIALHHAVAEGRLRSGQWIVLAAFGGGLTWGTALLRW